MSVALSLLIAGAHGQVEPSPRQSVLFSINQTTSLGQSVYVLGDLPELGGWDMRLAVKLEASGYPTWRTTISLPAGRSYAYRYVLRSDAPDQQKNSSNGSFITPSNITASTAAQTSNPASKSIVLTWGFANPKLWYRLSGYADHPAGAYASVTMTKLSRGNNDRPGDSRWGAWGFLPAGRQYDFYFTDASGTNRYPSTGNYTTSLDGVFVQDGQQYTYLPATNPDGARRDYSTSAVPSIYSPQLNETRYYRVFLPRGYTQHATRRYPVLYMHDGQNVFDQGAFGTWNAATQIASLQSLAQMREIIVVAIDNGPNRSADYGPPDDGGWWAYKYGDFLRDTLKPFIDSTYRTLTGPETTGTLGSSRGGNVSIYLGWDYPEFVRRVGSMSSALQLVPNFVSRIKAQPARNFTWYLDSSDAGYVDNDNYYRTLGLRDFFTAGTSAKYALEGTMRYVVGWNSSHDEASWAYRLPGCLQFLYPPSDGRNDLLSDFFGAHWDTLADGVMNIEDHYAIHRAPVDINRDGATNAQDLRAHEGFFRRDEARNMGGSQR